jgi:ribulose-phosphate 3-epimerase
MWPRLEEPPTLSTTKPPVRAVSHSFILSSAVLPPALLMSPCRPSPETPIDVAKQIHDAGMKAGIAISPDTPADVISQEIADSVDMILVMTVHPGQPALPTQTRSSQAHQTLLTPLVYHLAHLSGKGGQKFMEECMPKVRRLRFPDDSPSPLADAEPPHRLSSCSFGPGNIRTCACAGANVIVAGSSIFNAKDSRGVITGMREVIDEEIKKAEA